MSYSPQSADKHFHYTAQTVRNQGVQQSFDAQFHDLGIRIVNSAQHAAEHIDRAAEHRSHNNDYRRTLQQYKIYIFVFVRAVVLTYKRKACLRNGVHRYIHETFYVRGGGIACHCHIAESVYRRLYDHVGKRKNRSL